MENNIQKVKYKSCLREGLWLTLNTSEDYKAIFFLYLIMLHELRILWHHITFILFFMGLHEKPNGPFGFYNGHFFR